MKILIAYGTTEGQTRKICEAVADQIGLLGHETQLYDTSGRPGEGRPDAFDKVIVAGSVHQRGHQQSVGVFALANKAALKDKPTLLLSVSLSAAFPDGMAEAQSYVDDFIKENGWEPDRTLLVAGATRVDEYDYFQAQIIEHVVLKDRRVDNVDGSYEFTDWAALAKAIEAFVDT